MRTLKNQIRITKRGKERIAMKKSDKTSRFFMAVFAILLLVQTYNIASSVWQQLPDFGQYKDAVSWVIVILAILLTVVGFWGQSKKT